MELDYEIIVIGSGIFGITAAIELQYRGYRVGLIDPGPLPHPLAASTDISKVIRMEYGTDIQYMEMAELAIEGWRLWNAAFGQTLYHETGVAMFTKDEMKPGGFEYESYHTALSRGHQPERLDAEAISRRFPAWKHGAYVDGFYHKAGGFAESAKTVATLVEKASKDGVEIITGFAVASILTSNQKITGVQLKIGNVISANQVIVAAGVWTPLLVPELGPVMKASGHPVFHLKIKAADRFLAPVFPVFTADVARTGWYGFPVHPTEHVIKVATHDIGNTMHPEHDPREVNKYEENALRLFLSESFPELRDAEIVFTRRCLYCDTLDEHFWIDHHPEKEGLVVASGGSGHGFKFAPVLGPLIADCVEKKHNRWLDKFRWRALETGTKGQEAARFHG